MPAIHFAIPTKVSSRPSALAELEEAILSKVDSSKHGGWGVGAGAGGVAGGWVGANPTPCLFEIELDRSNS